MGIELSFAPVRENPASGRENLDALSVSDAVRRPAARQGLFLPPDCSTSTQGQAQIFDGVPTQS